MNCDLKIINGCVVDTCTSQITHEDLYIRDGVIVTPDSDSSAAVTIDAAGSYVLPGLIDEHAHLNYRNSNIGMYADLQCIPMGVTTAVDPGSTGWANFEGLYYDTMLRSKTDVYAYLHVTPNGVNALAGTPESANPSNFNEKAILKVCKAHPDRILGLKLRMNSMTLGNYGIAPLERTMEIAEFLEEETGRHYLVEVHFDNLPENVRIAAILKLLRPGDIFLHVFQMKGETIFHADGTLKEEVREAQARGILMDDAHGRMLWSFDHLRKAVAQRFMPDIISSDVVHTCEYLRPACNLLHAMNVDFAAGMDPMAIFRAVTYNPAKALGLLDKAGTLHPGVPADICILKIADIQQDYRDWWGGSCHASRVFVPLMTIKNGEIVYRQTFF